MGEIFKTISKYEEAIIIGLGVVMLVLFIMGISILSRQSKLKKKNEKLMEILELSEGNHIEDSLISTLKSIENFRGEIKRVDDKIEVLNRSLIKSFKKIGLVKFNAFDNIGAALSFSLTLLDDEFNGIILTSIYGNDKSNMYSKSVSKGKTDKNLSEEEAASLKKAIEDKI